MESPQIKPAEMGRPSPPPVRDRRRRVRHTVHTPAYASLSGASGGQFADLNEILNISEEGMAIQISAPLAVDRRVSVFLDLSETRANIQTIGQVIWSDRSGRVGMRFQHLPAASLHQLKEWLFVNAIVACAHFAAEQLPEVASETFRKARLEDSVADAGPVRREPESPALADYSSILVALGAVQREVESLGSHLEEALRLIAARAEVFTHAGGAAIALSEGAQMICRASAGADAPSVGARLKIGAGFSGECVRTGRLLRCADSEIDPLADRETCRALGIRSMIAVPIRWERAVIGLLEVFSPQPNAFSASDDAVLQRLAEIVARAVYRAGSPEESSSQAPTASVDDEFPAETIANIGLPQLPTSRKLLLGAAVATLALAMIWLMGPWGGNGTTTASQAAQQTSSKAVSGPPSAATAPPPATINLAGANDLEGMRRLADQGDAAAQFAVGARYATGDDVPQDYAEAVRWFSRAAEQGHVVAQATLGAYYWAGRGVSLDLVKAYFWSVLAQAGGDEASKYRVAVLASRMTRSQIVTAQQQANEWIKEHQSISKNSVPAR